MYGLFNTELSPEFRHLQVIMGTSVAQLSIKNPAYIPAPPLLNNETLKLRIYQDPFFPDGIDAAARFRQFGTTTNFVFAESDFAVYAQHSEVVTFSVFAFVDTPQLFLDANFLPIETSIFANITVWDTSESDVTSLVTCDESSSKHVLFSLPARLFWGKATVSLAFCPPAKFSNVPLNLRAHVLVQNLNRSLFLSLNSHLFSINSTGEHSINVTRQPHKVLLAATVHDNAFRFRYYFGNTLDMTCESGEKSRFKYSIVLSCEGKVSVFRHSLVIDGWIESTQCLQNITGMYFTRPVKNCFFNISAGASAIVFVLSSVFDVVPGMASNAMLIGTGPNCASAGSIVWSVNSTTEGLCLVAQLTDAEGNNVTYVVNASVIARSVTSSDAVYRLSRNTFTNSSESGLIKWYNVYSAKQQNAGIVFGANVHENIVYWNSSVINVSSAGLPALIVPNISAEIHNQTLLPGAPSIKLTFSLQDAGGNPINGLSGVAIRVRVVPQGNALIGRSAASILMASRGNVRQLLNFIVSSASSCVNSSSTELQLEFVFTLNSSSSENSVGPEFLCRAGTNDVIYDIGTLSGGFFTTTQPSAFLISVTVFPGDFQSFMFIPYPIALVVQTYTLINFLEVVFLDLGLNVVNGNVTMSLASADENQLIYPTRLFTIGSNSSLKAVLPPFFHTCLQSKRTESWYHLCQQRSDLHE
jgi:hypothetical protein